MHLETVWAKRPDQFRIVILVRLYVHKDILDFARFFQIKMAMGKHFACFAGGPGHCNSVGNDDDHSAFNQAGTATFVKAFRIGDQHLAHPVVDGTETVVELGDHTAADDS